MTKAAKVREMIVAAKANKTKPEAVVELVVEKLGFSKALARAYVTGNWDKAGKVAKPKAKKAAPKVDPKLAEKRAKDAARKREKRAAEKAAKEAAPVVEAVAA